MTVGKINSAVLFGVVWSVCFLEALLFCRGLQSPLHKLLVQWRVNRCSVDTSCHAMVTLLLTLGWAREECWKGSQCKKLMEPSGERKAEPLGLISLAAIHSSVLKELADLSVDSFLRSQERSVGVEVCCHHRKWCIVERKWSLAWLCVSYLARHTTWNTICTTLWVLTAGLLSSSKKIFPFFDIPECLSSEVRQNYLHILIFYLFSRWGNEAAKCLISIMLRHFHLDAEHFFSWSDFKICRINAIFLWRLFLCCSKWEWELSVAKKVDGRWQKLIPMYSFSWEKGPADFLLFLPSADKMQFWSWCVSMLEFARDQLLFSTFKSPGHCNLADLHHVPFRLPRAHLFVGFLCPVCLPVVLELLSLILGRGSGGGKDPAENY